MRKSVQKLGLPIPPSCTFGHLLKLFEANGHPSSDACSVKVKLRNKTQLSLEMANDNYHSNDKCCGLAVVAMM